MPTRPVPLLCLALALALAGASATRPAAAGFTKTTIYTFPDDTLHGGGPVGTPVLDASGNLYGVTSFGGPMDGSGTVFQLAPDGTLTTLATFQNFSPTGGLLRDGGGNLYGTLVNATDTQGAAFRLAPGGSPTILASFAGVPGTPALTAGGTLIIPIQNAITEADGPIPGGAVVALSPAGSTTTLATFGAAAGGPSGVVLDGDGNIYGTTAVGGTVGGGTAFRIAPDGSLTTLATFAANGQGASPLSGLVRDAAGDLYGTIADNLATGSTASTESVFRIAPDGTLTTLANFGNRTPVEPNGGLVFDAAGNLYGTTAQGGPIVRPPLGIGVGGGSVFQLTPAGLLTTLGTFDAVDSGTSPAGGLARDAAGNLYGTAYEGGSGSNGGTIYRLSPADSAVPEPGAIALMGQAVLLAAGLRLRSARRRRAGGSADPSRLRGRRTAPAAGRRAARRSWPRRPRR